MKQSVFHNKSIVPTMDNNTIPCKDFHGIDGKCPQSTDIQFDGRVCDCGKIKFYKEKCGCPANVTPTYELKTKANEQ